MQTNMKKSILVGILLSTVMSASAQYPDLTDEAKKVIAEQKAQWKAHADSAWEVAFPIVVEEAKAGRPYVPWAGMPYDLKQAKIPAFPGAEGGGMYTFGGRGGKVLTVTNLNDDGPGSFRWACEQGGARIIVFNVSGIIRLKSPIYVRAPYVTIAGQTAPGEGVCIAGESFQVDTHDVIVRHMRFRRGETLVTNREDSFGGNPVGNIMIDHCSCEWGLDENISFYRHMFDMHDGKPMEKKPTVNVTIQNTISAKALDTWNHAFGSTIGGENTTFMRNLWADNTGRNPSIGWAGVFNFVNNVTYTWVHRVADGGEARRPPHHQEREPFKGTIPVQAVRTYLCYGQHHGRLSRNYEGQLERWYPDSRQRRRNGCYRVGADAFGRAVCVCTTDHHGRSGSLRLGTQQCGCHHSLPRHRRPAYLRGGAYRPGLLRKRLREGVGQDREEDGCQAKSLRRHVGTAREVKE